MRATGTKLALRAVPGGTTLRITEDGEVHNPVFQFMSRFIFTHHRTIDRYLRDVASFVRVQPSPTP